jgi:4-amino-4-deoxy-L-arabinose transferase-like glycosyltransferase
MTAVTPSTTDLDAPPSEATAIRGRRWPVSDRDRLLLTGIVVVGVVLRVAWSVYAARPPEGLQDPALYTLYGDQIAAGRGYRLPDGAPTAYYPVGYPALLGAVFWLADHTPLPSWRPGLVAGLNVAMAAVSLVLVFEVARRAFDRRVALVGTGLLAIFPNLVFHTALPLTETVFNTLSLAAVLVLVATDWRRRHVGALVAFGLLVGAAALVRPPSLAFLPAMLVAGWWGARWGWREAGRALAVSGLAAAAVIAPWTVRNAEVMTSPVLISTNTGDNLCIGNNPDANGAFQMPASCLAGFDHLERPEYELARDAHGRRKALEYLREHPTEQLRLVPLRLYHTFRHDTDGLRAAESYDQDPFIPTGTRRVLEVVANGVYFATLAGALASVPLLLRGRRPDRLLVLLVAVALTLPPLAFFGDVRFKVPVVPYLVVAAAAVAVAGADRLRADRR